MSKACWQSSIIDEEGNILAGAQVEVRDADTLVLVSLWEDREGVDGLSNPAVDVDADGFVRLFVDEGTYKITVSQGAYTRVYEYVPVFENTNSGDSSGYLSVSIAAGNVDDWAPPGLDTSVGVLDVNPSAGATSLRGIDASLLRDGQELTITNVHASNPLTLEVEDTGSAAANRFRGSYDLTLNQYMSVKVKKSAGASRLILIP
jgi:hypothetical protein